MLFLSNVGWLTGISKTAYFIVMLILGTFYIYEGIKSKVKLVTSIGLLTVFGALAWICGFLDFITIILTGANLDNELIYRFSWFIGYFSFIFGQYVGVEILTPKKRWYLLFLFFLIQFFAMFENLYFGELILIYPLEPGGELINDILVSNSTGYLVWFLVFGNLFFIGGGLLYKSIQSKGSIRKKFAYVALYFILTMLITIFEAVFSLTGYFIPLVFAVGLLGSWLGYLGLRKEPEKHKEKGKEKVKVKDSLFRIIQRPEQITEEEVSYYREQKICLICKGKVAGFNIFLCSNCEALYHEDCARTLTELENACWVCNEPIDKTKPTKPFKIIEEKIAAENLKEPGNNSKVDKKNLNFGGK